MGPQADPSPLGTQLAHPLAGCRATQTLFCPRLMGAPSLTPSDGLLPTEPFGGGTPSTVHLVYLSALPGASAARLHGTPGKWKKTLFPQMLLLLEYHDTEFIRAKHEVATRSNLRCLVCVGSLWVWGLSQGRGGREGVPQVTTGDQQ